QNPKFDGTILIEARKGHTSGGWTRKEILDTMANRMKKQGRLCRRTAGRVRLAEVCAEPTPSATKVGLVKRTVRRLSAPSVHDPLRARRLNEHRRFLLNARAASRGLISVGRARQLMMNSHFFSGVFLEVFHRLNSTETNFFAASHYGH